MSGKRDYYEVLGVQRNADADEIRKAYRRLARQYHPDVNGDSGAEEQFKEINEAHEILSDSERRAAYDRYGHAAFAAGGAGAGDPFGFGGRSPFGDLFETFFGGFGRQGQGRAVPRGADVKATVELTFEEAVFGAEKDVHFNRFEPCGDCHGTRMRGGAQPQKCVQCAGSGEVRRVQNTILGQIMTSAPCDRCGGEGVLITDPCPTCRGRGKVSRTAKMVVTIPPGVDEQSTLRLTGQGEQVTQGVPGNLFVALKIKPHAELRRAGNHIHFDLAVNIAQAALGAELRVPTVDGPALFSVPPGTQPMQQFRMRGKGVPGLRGGARGDQLVTVHVVVPTELNGRQRELFGELGTSLGEAKMPKDKGFFDKMKDALGV